jgi:hypothetical protein
MSWRKTYTISWTDSSLPASSIKGQHWTVRHNRTRTVSGYSAAIRIAKRAGNEHGSALLWDERGVQEPTNNGLDHFYIRQYIAAR